jgi:xanthine dehydrogenase/oxidase
MLPSGWTVISSGPPPITATVLVEEEIDDADTITWRSTASFYINGKLHTLADDVSPRLTLAQYLRENVGLTGTKIGCNEGGCGACTVVLSFNEPSEEGEDVPKTVVVNSCLRPIASCDGMSITTVEGIGSKRKGLHPIQERIVKANGTQCGFCTPGFVTSMYGFLQKNPTNPKKTSSATSPPSVGDIQDHFDGHICRCTGYRPILAAMSSFAVPSEEKGNPNSCSKHCCVDIEDLCRTVPYDGEESFPRPSNASRSLLPLHLSSETCDWYCPLTLAQVTEIYKAAKDPNDVQLINGNTASGILKYYDGSVYGEKVPAPLSSTVIEVRLVKEMNGSAVNSDGSIALGGSRSLEELIGLLKQTGVNDKGHMQMANHIERVANHQVRSVGGWAGNLCFAKEYNTFPSDIALLLVGAGAMVQTISPWDGEEANITVESFLSSPDSREKPLLLVSLTIPPLNGEGQAYCSYKLAARRQNSHATINVVSNIRAGSSFAFVYHVENLAGPVHATTMEAYINAHGTYDQDCLTASLSCLQTDMKNSGVQESSPEFLQCQSCLYKVFMSLQSRLDPALRSGVEWELPRNPSKGTELYPDPESPELPVSKAIPKLSAALQTTGEAKYTNDVATESAHEGLLYGALVKSTVPLALLKAIDTSVILGKLPGVIDVITAADIPGSNNINILKEDEFVFTPIDGKIECCGQALACVLADSQRHACAGALALQASGITYNPVPSEKPILTLEEAIEQKNFFDLPSGAPFAMSKGNPDIDKALDSAPHKLSGTVHCASEKHFYMETQRAFVKPAEDGEGLEVLASTQDLDTTQKTVAQVMKLPYNQVVGKMIRAGGGFGGKSSRQLPVVCAAAVAAAKHQTPVKVVNERVDDMIMVAGRERAKVDYTVGFDDNGKILAFKEEFYMDAGFTDRESQGDLNMACYMADNAYNIPNWASQGFLLKTNNSTHCSMRAPGVVHSIHVMERVLESIADYLPNLQPSQVRSTNFYQAGDKTPYAQPLVETPTLERTWTEVQTSAGFETLQASVASFNKANRWRKRGVALIPVKYGMQQQGFNMEATVHVYPDGSITLVHGGMEIGQGINTKVAQCCAYALSAPLENVRVANPSTVKISSSGNTGGSATSECSCAAVMIACKVIVSRLAPYKSKYNTWAAIIAAASNDNVMLSASGQYSPTPYEGHKYRYFVWGSSISVVELDVLTGETEILLSSLVYDCGVSLNPAIDIGQVEGAFVFGIGTFLMEEVLMDENGILLTNGTWDYKPPASKSIPVEFNVKFLENSNNPSGILSSKATGEPPYSFANSVYFALRRCINAARLDAGLKLGYDLDIPATQKRIVAALAVDPIKDFQL